MATAGSKTIIRCRPGMLQAIRSAFAGMEVVVDDKLTVDYEFSERELTGMELIEAEVEQEERFEADPKRAITVIVPLVRTESDFDDAKWTCSYLAIRVDASKGNEIGLIADVREVEPILDDAYEVNAAATIGAISSHLKSKQWKVYSISEATGAFLLGS